MVAVVDIYGFLDFLFVEGDFLAGFPAFLWNSLERIGLKTALILKRHRKLFMLFILPGQRIVILVRWLIHIIDQKSIQLLLIILVDSTRRHRAQDVLVIDFGDGVQRAGADLRLELPGSNLQFPRLPQVFVDVDAAVHLTHLTLASIQRINNLRIILLKQMIRLVLNLR